jgi:hypothetical protein
LSIRASSLPSARSSRSTNGKRTEIFGGGVNAFSRYETGKTKPPLALGEAVQGAGSTSDLLAEIRMA